jgi:hypothetical protein
MALNAEFQYFKAHLRDLVSKYGGKFVVIQGEQVIAVYEDELKAIRETAKTHELGTFLVQKCELDPEVYTQVFHSRVIAG